MLDAFKIIWRRIPKKPLYIIYIVVCLGWVIRFAYDVAIENKNPDKIFNLIQLVGIFFIVSVIYLLIAYVICSLRIVKESNNSEAIIAVKEKQSLITAPNNKLLSCVIGSALCPMYENTTHIGKAYFHLFGYCFITNTSEKQVAVAAVQINDKFNCAFYPFEYVGKMDWRGLINPHEHLKMQFWGYVPAGIFKKRKYLIANVTIIDNFSNKYKIVDVSFILGDN